MVTTKLFLYLIMLIVFAIVISKLLENAIIKYKEKIYKREDICPQCDGYGSTYESYAVFEPCSRCGGDGRYYDKELKDGKKELV